jgi:hypothetical protein
MLLIGCEEEKPTSPAPAVTSAPVAATTATASAPPPKPVAKPSHECPKGSEGEGTFKKPCMAKGKARMMEVKWTGKIDEKKGPSFRIASKSDLEILYGQLRVYFYDKAGKQLEVPGSGEGKTHPTQKCSGNIFAGPMKAGEKAVLWFSCVKKKHVPEGTVHIEAELPMVGFTGATGKKADTYWKNEDLAPDERPKGGVK